jgi:hypothetical protein
MEAGIQDFLERFNQPTYRGMRANRSFADSPLGGTGFELPVPAPAKVLSGGQSGCRHDNRSP